MKKLSVIFIIYLLLVQNIFAENFSEGYKIVKKSFDMWRGQDSAISNLTMIITRPDRIEQMSLKSWAKGDKLSVSKFISPAKYKGQAVLVKGDSMWTYSPKSRRSIKISNSLKSKSWMGSDMSYDDISLSIDTLLQYDYNLTRGTKNGDEVYIIEAVPFKNAPIVWGKETYYIRVSDNAMVAKEFFDQNGKMIRRFDALKISYYDGDKTKPIMRHMKVTNLEKEGYFTEFKIDDTRFNISISDDIFSLANLERP